jgi:hypothetical protein
MLPLNTGQIAENIANIKNDALPILQPRKYSKNTFNNSFY